MPRSQFEEQMGEGDDDNNNAGKSLLKNSTAGLRSLGQSSNSLFKRTMSIHHSAKAHLANPPKPEKGTFVSRLRLALRIVSLIISFAIVVTLGHAIAVYNSSKDEIQNNQPVWPTGLKMTPTILLLAAACVATALSLAVSLASFSAVIRHITNVGNIFTLVVSSICIVLWIAVAIVYKVDDLKPEEHWDLLSFTCARRHALNEGTANLHTLCYQMRYAWWGALALGLLEIGAVVTLVLGWYSLRGARKGKYARMEEDGAYKDSGARKESFQLSGGKAAGPGANVPFPVKVSKGREYWDVEDILKSRILPAGTTQYLIRWKNLGEDSDSWEPEGALTPEWIQYFKQQRGGGNEYWEVETILDSRTSRYGVPEYLIRWKGYSAANDSWESEENLSLELLKEFRGGSVGEA